MRVFLLLNWILASGVLVGGLGRKTPLTATPGDNLFAATSPQRHCNGFLPQISLPSRSHDPAPPNGWGQFPQCLVRPPQSHDYPTPSRSVRRHIALRLHLLSSQSRAAVTCCCHVSPHAVSSAPTRPKLVTGAQKFLLSDMPRVPNCLANPQ